MEYVAGVTVIGASVLISRSSYKNTSELTRAAYHSVGSFNVWLIGLGSLLGFWISLAVSLNWTHFAVIGMLPYLTSTFWGLSHVRVGSFLSRMSNSHRIMGTLSLFLPMICLIYQQMFEENAPMWLYLSACFGLMLNCLTGLFLIPTHIPSYDIPTLRAFHVGVTLGLAFVAQSLIFRFGQNPEFEIYGKLLVIYLYYAVLAAINDSAKHIYTNLNSPFYASQIDLEYFQPPKTAQEVGLKHKPFPLSYLFWENMWAKPADSVRECSVTPSSAAVVFTVTMTAFFACENLLMTHYLICGSSGLAHRAHLFPKTTQWSAYIALLAGVANNFGTFAGTVVVKKRVSSFIGAFFNAIGLLIPVITMFVFMSRNPEENMFYYLTLMECGK